MAGKSIVHKEVRILTRGGQQGSSMMIIQYRATEEEARELADSNEEYEFIGLGYNYNFPNYWAVKVYDGRQDDWNHENQ
jgi:hypothetical protein